MPASISFTVNGKASSIESDPERSLLEVLREDLQLTGTKYGCGEGACGACSVLVDGKRRFSCSTTISEVSGKSIQTIEGLASGETLHPVQQAFLDCHGFQCGFCTTGMIMSTVALLKNNPAPSRAEICKSMDGNICRCCAHVEIVNAIKKASELVKG